MKKIISLVLCFSMIIGILPVSAFAEEKQSLEDIIRPQIEAFAKSIDQKGAAGKAADALATQGMFGRGKDLRVGKDHAITAMIMNSELAKKCLLDLCAEMIKTKDEFELDKIYGCEGVTWKIQGNNEYYFMIYDYNYKWNYASDGEFYAPTDGIKKSEGHIAYTPSNEYDESLEWIAGGCAAKISMKTAKTYKDKIVYDVNVEFGDYFNFSAEGGSELENLLGFIGMLMFNPFYWYSTFDFQVEIPNDCEHSFSDWKTAAEANCTESGREERTCINCGCVDTKSTAALGHSFGEWYEAKAPTYFEEGEEQRSCSACGTVESRSIAALEYLLGDVNGDEKINVIDANLVRRYAAKFEELSEKQLAAADTNGDGKVNVLDANLIRKFAAKIITEFTV